MFEEKISGDSEEITENQIDQEKEITKKNSLENVEVDLEESEVKTEDKIKQAGNKIVASKGSNQEDEVKISNHVKDVASLDVVEDQIQKLTEIATQDSPKTALKVARALNDNYVLDKMHDRLINEDELREVLIKKGFIDNV